MSDELIIEDDENNIEKHENVIHVSGMYKNCFWTTLLM